MKVPRLDGRPDGLGLYVLDQPCVCMSQKNYGLLYCFVMLQFKYEI